MSELKVIHAYTIDETEAICSRAEGDEYYLKSEADKVIAELKAQKAQAEDDCAYWKMSEGNAANAMHETEEYAMQLYKELCHQKYKRCKNMSQHCYDKWLDTEGRKSCWWRHWQLVWLELAERFKEGK